MLLADLCDFHDRVICPRCKAGCSGLNAENPAFIFWVFEYGFDGLNVSLEFVTFDMRFDHYRDEVGCVDGLKAGLLVDPWKDHVLPVFAPESALALKSQ